MSKKIRVGIVGYGWVATAPIAAINATTNAEVTAVYSSRPWTSAGLACKWGAALPRPVARGRRIVVAQPGDPDPPGWLHRLLATHPRAVEGIARARAYGGRAAGAAGGNSEAAVASDPLLGGA